MSLWISTPDLGACRPLAQLAGSKCAWMADGKAYPCGELAGLIAGLFPARPTKRNPAVLNCYTFQSESAPALLLRAFPPTGHVQPKFHPVGGGSSLAKDLLKVVLRELCTFEIDRVAHFSLLSSPELISLYAWGPQHMAPLKDGHKAPDDIPTGPEAITGLRSKVGA